MPLILHPASTCDLCGEEYTYEGRRTPYTIPCGHLLCKDCFHSMQTFECPFCRARYNWTSARKLFVDGPPLLSTKCTCFDKKKEDLNIRDSTLSELSLLPSQKSVPQEENTGSTSTLSLFSISITIGETILSHSTVGASIRKQRDTVEVADLFVYSGMEKPPLFLEGSSKRLTRLPAEAIVTITPLVSERVRIVNSHSPLPLKAESVGEARRPDFPAKTRGTNLAVEFPIMPTTHPKPLDTSVEALVSGATSVDRRDTKSEKRRRLSSLSPEELKARALVIANHNGQPSSLTRNQPAIDRSSMQCGADHFGIAGDTLVDYKQLSTAGLVAACFVIIAAILASYSH